MCGASAHAMGTYEQLGMELRTAAGSGNESLVKELLHQGAPVDSKDNDNGWTPLMCAASHNHKNVCLLLIAHNASVDAQDSCGRTTLIWAAKLGNKDICQLLIEAQASAEARDHDGKTALMWAARKRHHHACLLLIDTIVQRIQSSSSASAITFLGIKKFRAPAYLKLIDTNIMRLIARRIHTFAAEQKRALFAQINGIKNNGFRLELLEHARSRLKLKSKNN